MKAVFSDDCLSIKMLLYPDLISVTLTHRFAMRGNISGNCCRCIRPVDKVISFRLFMSDTNLLDFLRASCLASPTNLSAFDEQNFFPVVVSSGCERNVPP